MATTKTVLIGGIEIRPGPLSPYGRLVDMGVMAADVYVCLTPDEVRALIDALTPYARRRPPWRGGKRKP